jgi:hypothetical protein
MNVGDETTTTQMIHDLTEVYFINLEIQLTYVVLAMTFKPRLVPMMWVLIRTLTVM